MVRFLLYANEWDIEGIIHCSSKFHWKGNGKNIKAHGWADEIWLDKQIDQYEQVYPKLSQHAKGFPTADALRKLEASGKLKFIGIRHEGAAAFAASGFAKARTAMPVDGSSARSRCGTRAT